ncbi:MAG: helix-turn-helix domain-containing protein [Anaerolineales bacterium]|jgi:hypothetical protein
MENVILWDLMRNAWSRIEARYKPALNQMVSRSKLTIREWMLLIATLTFEPEDTTPSHLMVRGPYTSSDKYLAGLEKAAGAGYLVRVGDGRYRLSEEGKKAVQELIRVAREAMTPPGNLTHQELSELAEQLNKLVNNCLEAPPPPDSWSITLSHKLMPPMDPPLPFIEQSISCLKAYRDDAHLASWCSSGLSASAMESLTLIWRGQVYTFQELLAKLYFRGHPDVVYLDAIAELRANGYLTGSRNNIKITSEGIKFRDQVEQKTEEYFFRPWDRLSESERRQIAGILEQI